MKDSMEASQARLAADFRLTVADAEELLKASAEQGGERLAEARARAQESLREAKARMAGAPDAMMARARAAARATGDYVHDRPWQVLGIAACFVLALIFLIRRD